MRAGCRALFLFLLPMLLISSIGCRNRTDLVETELRTRETMYREAMADQRHSESRILSLQREIEALRQGVKIPAEQAAQTFGLKRITLGRSTAALDHDNKPGDELLQVVIEPRDESDHTIKAPGTLQIIVLEIHPQGSKLPLCQWDIDAEKLRQSWKQGLLSTGYTLTLPWKVLPTTEMVRVVVRFVTPDQRLFEADKDIKVRLVPGAAQKRLQGMPTNIAPCPLPGFETAPPILMPMNRVTPSSWTPVSDPSWPRNPGGGISVGRPLPIP